MNDIALSTAQTAASAETQADATNKPAAAVAKADMTKKMYGFKSVFGVTTNLMGDDISAGGLPGFTFHPEAPSANPNYKFRKELFIQVAYFLIEPKGNTLTLVGPTGCGKTSTPKEICARLQWPVTEVTADEDMLIDSLLIKWEPDGKGGMLATDGPLTRAFREGHVFILNEVDALTPGKRISLNALRDNGTLTVRQLGETIQRHKNFRMIFTANTQGQGDQTGLYAGVKRQNVASSEGLTILVDYPEPDLEIEILKAVAPSLADIDKDAPAPADIIPKMVKVANELRANSKIGGADSISLPMSTRTLVNWAQEAVQYSKSPAPLAMSLKLAYANRLDEDERVAVMSTCAQVFGDQWRAE